VLALYPAGADGPPWGLPCPGCVVAARQVADQALEQGLLPAPDAAALVRAAQDSAVLR
jgi:hypothetical protein